MRWLYRLHLTHIYKSYCYIIERRGDKRITISRTKDSTTFLFSDDQIIVVGSEDAIQISTHELEKITSKYGLQISTSKMKTMAFKGTDPVRSKIVINNNITEQMNTFNYLDCFISYHNERDTTVKISEFLHVMGNY